MKKASISREKLMSGETNGMASRNGSCSVAISNGNNEINSEEAYQCNQYWRN